VPNAIHQEIEIDAQPARVYKALTDPAEFGELTGQGAAALTADAGAPFSLFDGHITGRTVESVADRRLVQAWRAASWPDGVYSIVNFQLQADGDDEQTRLVFDQAGFPEEAHDELASGWHKMYWEPLKRYLS
jgi:uncharacterized protein YndB with AHSA1/START domain